MSERRIGISFDVNGEDLQKLEKAVTVMDNFNKKVSTLQKSAGSVSSAFDKMERSQNNSTNTQMKLTKIMKEFDSALKSQSFEMNSIGMATNALSKRLEQFGRTTKARIDDNGRFTATLKDLQGQTIKVNGTFDQTTNKLTNVRKSVIVTNDALAKSKKSMEEFRKEAERMKGIDISNRLPKDRTWDVQKDSLVAYGKVLKGSIDRNNIFTQTVVKQNGEVRKITGYYNKAKGALVQYNEEVGKASKTQLQQAGFDNSAINRVGLMADSMKGLNKYTISWNEAMAISATRMVQWGVAGSVIFGAQRAFKAMISTIIELDSQMTQLRRVLDDDVNIDALFDGAIRNANTLGIKLTEINESMIEFGRQGFDETQIDTLVKATGMMKNVADMDLTSASENITAYLATFHKGVNDTLGYVDRLNEVDNKYAVSVAQLSDSVRKAGGTANAFGVTIDNLIGYTTAIGESTRESGNVIGNSLKTIFSRMTTNSQAIKALDQVGISMESVGGKSKTVDQILAELHGKWDTLSDAEKQNTAVKVAGTHQLNRFLILMQNYDEAMKASETSTKSWGSATRENQKFMDSMQANINKFYTALENLAKAMGDSGIGAGFLMLVKGATTVVNGLTVLVDKLGAFSLTVPAVGAVVTALAYNFTTLGKSTDALKTGLVPVNPMITNLATRMGASTQMATVMGGAVGKLTMTLRGLAMATVANPLFWIPLAISGVVALVGHMDNVKKHQEDLNKTAKDANKEYKAFLETVNTGKIEPYDVEKFSSQIEALKGHEKDLTKQIKDNSIELLNQGAQYSTLGINVQNVNLSKSELNKKYAEETSAMKVLNDEQEQQIASMGIKITQGTTIAELQDKLKGKEKDLAEAVKKGKEALEEQRLQGVLPTADAYNKLTDEIDENATAMENAIGITDKIQQQMKEQRAIIELLSGVKNKDSIQTQQLENAYKYWSDALGVSQEELKKHPELMNQQIKKNQELMDVTKKMADGTATAEEKKRAQQLLTTKNTEEQGRKQREEIERTERKRREEIEASNKKYGEFGNTFKKRTEDMSKDSRAHEITVTQNFQKERESLQQTIDKHYAFAKTVSDTTNKNNKNMQSQGKQATDTGNKHKEFSKKVTSSSNTVKGSLDSLLKNGKTNFSGVRGQIDQTKTKQGEFSKKSSSTAKDVNNAHSSIFQGSKKDLGKARDQVEQTKDKYDELEDTAKNIPLGIAKGILNAIADPQKAIAKLAQKLVDKFKEVLGIHSPSRVFMEMGGHVVDGLINGLDFKSMKKLGESAFKDFAGGAFKTIKDIKAYVSGDFSGLVGGGAGVDKWKGLATKALSMTGQLTPANLSRLLMQMRTESGGNARSINLWDSNAKKGIPSKGLMQVIDPTFRAYAMPGFNKNIYDPLSNMLASIRYTLARYGSLARGWKGHGYADGGITDAQFEQAVINGSVPNGGLIKQPHFVAGGRGIAGEAGPEAIIPLSSKRRGRAMELYDQVGKILGIKAFANGGIVSPGLYKYGSRGQEVKDIQKIVGTAIDGIFGPKTLKAVKDFQKAMGLVVDGIVGKNTIAKLNAKVNGSNPSVPKSYFSNKDQAQKFLETGQSWASFAESIGIRNERYRVRTMTSAKYREAFEKTGQGREYDKMVIDGLSNFSNAKEATKLFKDAKLFLNAKDQATALNNILKDVAKNALTEVNEKTTDWLDNFNSKVIQTNDSIKGLIDISNQVDDRKGTERQNSFVDKYVSDTLSKLGVADQVDPTTALQKQADDIKSKIESRANENAMLEWRLSSALIDPRKAQLQNYINQLNNQISNTKKDFSNRGVTDNSVINEALKPLQDRLSEVKSEYDELMYSINNSNKALEDNKSELDSLAKQYKDLQDQISKAEDKREFTDIWGNLVRDAEGNVKTITSQGQLIMDTYAKVRQEMEQVKSLATGTNASDKVNSLLDQLNQTMATVNPTINTEVTPSTAVVTNNNSTSNETKTYEANTTSNRNVTYIVQAGVVLASESEMKEFAMIIKDMIDEEEGRSKS